MAFLHQLVRSSISPLGTGQINPTSTSPDSEYIRPFSNSIDTPAQGSDIELRQRRPHNTKFSTTDQNVIHPHLPSLSPTRETSSDEFQCDSGERDRKPCHLRWSNHCRSLQLSSTAAKNTSVPSTPTKVLQFECDKILGINSNITVSLVSSHDSRTRRSDPRPAAARYHAQISGITPSAPDIVLRRIGNYASSEDCDPTFSFSAHNYESTIIATAHFRWSRHVRMGFDFPTITSSNSSTHAHKDRLKFDMNHKDIAWEEMRNTSRWSLHYRYEFEVPLPIDTFLTRNGGNDSLQTAPIESPETVSSIGTTHKLNFSNDIPTTPNLADYEENHPLTLADRELCHLVNMNGQHNGCFRLFWYRTNRPEDGVTSFYSRFLMMNFKLILLHPQSTSSSNGACIPITTCLAVLLAPSSPSLTMRSTLKLFGHFSEELETAIVLSALAIDEKGSRRRCYGYKGVTAGP